MPETNEPSNPEINFELTPIEKIDFSLKFDRPIKESLQNQISHYHPEEDVPVSIFLATELLKGSEATQVREQCCIHNMKATIRDVVSLPEDIPVGRHVVGTPEHRKQSGPYCALESVHRTLQAVGISVSADQIVQRGRELGMADGTPLIMLHGFEKKLGIPEAQVQMWPELQPINIDREIMERAIREVLFKKIVSLSEGITETKFQVQDERKVDIEKLTEWIDLLNSGEGLVVQANNAAEFWCIPEMFRAKGDMTHAIVVLGYEVDQQGRLGFLVYDPGLPEAPIKIGAKHIAENTARHYLRVSKRVNS